MNISKKYALGLTSIVLAGTVALGGVASAAGNDDGGVGSRNRPQLTTEEKCERQEQIAEKVATMQQRITDRIATLEDKRAEAEAEGNTERVANIDRRIARLEKAQLRIETRYGKYQAWVSENC